ncbi:unnamed protein product, partial [Sphacelaria rigidula]
VASVGVNFPTFRRTFVRVFSFVYSVIDLYRTNQPLDFVFSIPPLINGVFDPRSTFFPLSSNQASEIVGLVIRTSDDSSHPCHFSTIIHHHRNAYSCITRRSAYRRSVRTPSPPIG